jgi:AraC family transcriptional regulator of adaptative response/methylated-DNA-[protein]-cysteine methyltransferase
VTRRPCIAATVQTPIGEMVAAAHEGRICLLEYLTPGRLDAQLASIRRYFGDVTDGNDAALDLLRAELSAYFAGALQTFSVPLAMKGTPFQERVWSELLRIPYGATHSYEDIARSLSAPGSQRAVGHANGSNRIAILIPCHRVINKSGKLGGYGGELWRKKALLGLEAAHAQHTLFT